MPVRVLVFLIYGVLVWIMIDVGGTRTTWIVPPWAGDPNGISRQTEQARRSKPVSTAFHRLGNGSCLQLPSLGPCPDFPRWYTKAGKIKGTPLSPNWFWTCNFNSVMEPLIKMMMFNSLNKNKKLQLIYWNEVKNTSDLLKCSFLKCLLVNLILIII